MNKSCINSLLSSKCMKKKKNLNKKYFAAVVTANKDKSAGDIKTSLLTSNFCLFQKGHWSSGFSTRLPGFASHRCPEGQEVKSLVSFLDLKFLISRKENQRKRNVTMIGKAFHDMKWIFIEDTLQENVWGFVIGCLITPDIDDLRQTWRAQCLPAICPS